MIVTSIKFVDLMDGEYLGHWQEWKFIIPFGEEDMEIPVSKVNTNFVEYSIANETGFSNPVKYIMATVLDNRLTFEVP
jgi:hypothetical protein